MAMLTVESGSLGGNPRASRTTGSSSLAAGTLSPEPLDLLVVALSPLLEGRSSWLAPGARFVLGMMKSSTGGNTLNSPDRGKPKQKAK